MRIDNLRQTAAVLVALGGSALLQAASTIQFSATTYTVAENAGAVALTVQRTNDVDTIVSVDYATADGTATNGLKYTAVYGTLAFGAGETNKDIVVPILNEGFVEGIKTFTVSLTNPTGGAILGACTNATVRITDNDAGLQFEFSTYSVSEDAGSVLIGVVRGDDGNFPVTVDCATADVSATNGVDYLGVTNTLSYAAGEKVKRFAVPILNDSLKEANKTFRVTLSNPSGGGVLGSQRAATVTILDNDAGVQFESNRYWVREDEELLTVKVLRGSDVDLPPFTVDYATSNLTAVAGEDYGETHGTLAFGEGETFKLLTVPIVWNQVSELDRQFRLQLSNLSAGVVLGRSPVATITVLDMTGMEGHRFDGVAVLPDGAVQLTLGGGVHRRFTNYFDLYPIEVSSNLVDWAPLVTLQRTNSSTNALVYTDAEAGTASQRFYRTVTNHLITPVTQPTGPFPVGVVSRMLTDPSRRNRYHVSTNSSFMISLWYPAVARAGQLPDRLEDPQLAQDPGWPVSWSATPLPDREPYFMSHALPETQCASAQAPYPVLIFSHGAYDGRTSIMERGPEIASHGYVVVGVNHWDAFGTVFPDGSYLHGENASSFSVTTAGFQDRVRDLRFVLDRLEEWNRADAMFAGRLDLTNVATMGYSWGGGVAGEVARVDERCKAAIVLEGYFQNADELVRLGLSKPSLSIYAQPISLPGQELLLFNRVTHDAIWFQVTSTTHLTFLDYYWFSPTQIPGLREAMRTMNTYTLWFLNKYLKGSTEPMPALADYPRLINLKQK